MKIKTTYLDKSETFDANDLNASILFKEIASTFGLVATKEERQNLYLNRQGVTIVAQKN